ncbi:extensin family protein [Luteimonas aestuarii]|uniref:Extensin family protein n=1 Tax=Luteimonas aestuarii TaxID=453837 RepID=A0A4R5U3T3_9GAMM|nr:extensin family protein [Luteimonas aestuarii]TDK28371.1 extensin family protein [Luteimonas aestuarii]
MQHTPSPRPRRSLAGLLSLLLLACATWAWQVAGVRVPDAWNPWAPLRIDASPNLLTGIKLARASTDRVACREALGQAGMRLTALPDRETGDGCGFDNAYRIDRTSVAVGEPFSLSCRAALSLAMWERHALQQAADAHLGSPVARIEHLGSYACRNIYNADGRRRSQHATADAVDIAGFVLEDGRRIRVLSDWSSAAAVDSQTTSSPEDATEDEEAAFLRAVRDGACRWFDAVLGPEYNEAHADHFHFDRGPARICR